MKTRTKESKREKVKEEVMKNKTKNENIETRQTGIKLGENK
jgi:hypothetical protein